MSLTYRQISALPDSEFKALLRHVMRRVMKYRPERRHRGDSIAYRLSRMDLNETLLLPGQQQLQTNARIYARLHINDPEADWSGRVTNHGLRVTRVR